MLQARRLRQLPEGEGAWDVLKHKHPTLLGDIPTRLPADSGYVIPDFTSELVNVLRRYGDEWSRSEVQKGFASEYVDIVK